MSCTRQHRYFFLLFGLLLGLTAIWSPEVEEGSRLRADSSGFKGGAEEPGLPGRYQRRRELLEVMDRIVAYQHHYHSVYGQFTGLMSRIGFPIPPGVRENYEIRIARASKNRLLVTAVSEFRGRSEDIVSMDHEFKIRANFQIPSPRPEYLQAHALKHLRLLRSANPNDPPVQELSAFRGYFHYKIEKDADQNRVTHARGVRDPVLGFELTSGPNDFSGNDPLPALLSSLFGIEKQKPGPTIPASDTVMDSLEETYLAQKIFKGETGRYARNWNELSQVSDFRFDRLRKGAPGVPFGDAPGVLEIDSVGPKSRHVASDGLIIEPVSGSH